MKDEDRSSPVTCQLSSFRLHPSAKRIRSQLLDLCRQLRNRKGKLAAHRRRQIDHLDAAALQSDLLQQILGVFNSPASVEITFQVMTFAFQSTRHQHAIGAALNLAYQQFSAKGLQAFAPYSSDADHLTNKGHDSSTGVGLRLGDQLVGLRRRAGAAIPVARGRSGVGGDGVVFRDSGSCATACHKQCIVRR